MKSILLSYLLVGFCVVGVYAQPIAYSATNVDCTSFTANWSTVSGSSGFLLEYATNSSFTSATTTMTSLTSYTLSGLPTGTPYWYRVRALFSGVPGPYSNAISTATIGVAGVPVAIAATPVAGTSFTAKWNAVSGVTSYRLDVSTDELFGSFVSGYQDLLVNGTSQAVSGLSTGTIYWYRVRSYRCNISSGQSNKISVQTTGVLPAPTLLAATSITVSGFIINWQASSGATSYRLDVSATDPNAASNFLAGYNNATVNGTSATLTGLTANTRYYYRLRAVNTAGTSPSSPPSNTWTLPLPPTATAATDIKSSSFTANWTAVAGISEYFLDVSTKEDFSTFVGGYHDYLVTGTSLSVTGVGGAKYYYRLRSHISGRLSLYSNTILAVDLDMNYIKTVAVTVKGKTDLTAVETATVNERTIQYVYFDGIGRPVQSVSQQGSQSQKDIIMPVAYDAVGRESIKYLPYTDESNGLHKPNALIDPSTGVYTGGEQYKFYQTGGVIAQDTKPYEVTLFEPSPLNRPFERGAPGSVFQPDPTSTYGSVQATDHSFKHSYETNEANEVLKWTYTYPIGSAFGLVNADQSGTPMYYPAGQLTRSRRKDEHNNEVIEYKDVEDRTILKRVQTMTGTHSTTDAARDMKFASTYYIYDDFGNLVCVIPPQATRLITQTVPASEYFGKIDSEKNAFLSRWAFRYTFDARRRMAQKQLPGAGSIYMVYDARDRVVLTQDANQRSTATKYWTFTKYDMLNRPIATGIKDTTADVSQVAMQGVVDMYYGEIASANKTWRKWGETYIGSTAGNVHGYSNKSFPKTSSPGSLNADRYLSVTYYDNYDFKTLWGGRNYVNDTLTHKLNGVVQYQQEATHHPYVVEEMTGTKTKVLDNTLAGGYIWLRTVNYYDRDNRLIQTHVDNLQGGVDRTSTLYDFTGKILVTKQFHNVITWTSLLNASGSFSTLTRNGGSAAWNTSGGVSQSVLAAGEEGAYEFVTSETNAKKAIGFSSTNPDANYTSIQFCLLLNNDANFQVYESGTQRYTAAYAAGDVFRIERVGGVIKYYRNGLLIPISNTASSTQLMLDVGFGTSAAVIPYGTFTASSHPTVVTRRFKYDHAGRLAKTYHRLGQGELVNWTNVSSSISATDGVISRTTGSNGWTAGASSSQTIPASTDGWLEARSPQVNVPVMIGLSDQDVNVNYTSIDYAIYFYTNGTLYVYESGSSKGTFGTYTAKDVFRIERIGQTIVYKKNQRVFYTSAVPSTSVLLADCSIYQIGGALDQVHIGKGLGSSYVLTSENQYNELGQLIDKKLHSANGAAAKQSVDQRYNIRGWLTSINDAALPVVSGEPNDYFGMNLGYNDDIGSGNITHDPDLDASLVSHFPLNGNANDNAPGGTTGTITGSPVATADGQGAAGQAYSFTTTSYITMPSTQAKNAFVHNTGVFTISAFVKLGNIDARSAIIGNSSASTEKGFFFAYENVSGTADHQLRFTFVKAVSGQAFNAFGGVRTINDTNWHHVAVVGDGEVIRFYVDGVPDGVPVLIPSTFLSTGNATYNTTIARAGTLTLSGSLDEVTVLNRALHPDELQILVNRQAITSTIDRRQYNGNISGVKWSKNLGLSDVKMNAYSYSYDAMNRLSMSTHKALTAPNTWTPGRYDENILAYDLNGNILDLKRTGQSVSAGVRIDNMIYNYGTGSTRSNKLMYVQEAVVDATNSSKGFVDGNAGTATDYTYDANGNMISDANKGISTIIYNMLNLPLGVTRGSNGVVYTYDATGRKLAQTATNSKKTYYSGEFVYEETALQFVSHDEGRIAIGDETTIFKYGFDEVNLTQVPAWATSQAPYAIRDQKYVNFTHTDANVDKGPYDIGGLFPVVAGERYKVRMKGYRAGASSWMRMVFGATIIEGPTFPLGASTEAWVEMIATVPAGATTLSLRATWPSGSQNSNFYLNELELIKLESNAPEYQYNITDHLGNVRLSFTTKDEVDKFTATFEDNTQATESQQFENYSRVTNDLFDHTDAAAVYDKTQMLHGGNNSQIGIAKSIAVMPGDVIKTDVYARYLDTSSPGGNIANFSTALLAAFGAATPTTGEVGTPSAALESYGNFIEGNGGSGGNPTWPQGWLNVLVFDKNFVLVEAAIQQIDGDHPDYGHPVGSTIKGPHELLSKTVNITKPGYVYIYVSNEGAVQQEIYFDDMAITHTKSPIVQLNDYYPFGLTFDSWSRENTVPNQLLYNSKEHLDEMDLGWLDYGARMYIPEIGRWGVTDPMSEQFMRDTPYNYCLNDPIGRIDPDGMYTIYGFDGKPHEVGDDDVVDGYLDADHGDDEKKENKDMAILIAFPDKTAAIPSNGGVFNKAARILDKIGNKDGALPVDHAGIILVNGTTGRTLYFDFGRYDERASELGKRPDNTGVVRSSAKVKALSLPDAKIENGEIKNLNEIVQALASKPIFKGYGRVTAAVYKGLDFDKMLTHARALETKGYIPFGAPNKQYCARFAREVAEHGGAKFGPFIFTGQQNVNATLRRKKNRRK